MKRILLLSLLLIVSVPFVLFACGLFSIGISPYAYYRLNQNETTLLNTAISHIRQKVEAGDVESIRREISVNRHDERVVNDAVRDLVDEQEKYGTPTSMEFFRAMPPEQASKYFPGVAGTFYTVSYFTSTSRGELSEHFDFVTSEKNDDAKLFGYYAKEMIEWEIHERARDKFLNERYPNEVRIPFGSRFIEIRY